jgi:hypothetical protein
MASVGPLLVRGPVDVGEHVAGAAFQGPAEGDQFCQVDGYCLGDQADCLCQRGFSGSTARVTVGGNDVLVDRPRGLDLRHVARRRTPHPGGCIACR